MQNNKENMDLIGLWKSQDAKLDKIIELNQALIKQNLNNQVKSSLASLKSVRKFGIVIGVIWSLALAILLLCSWSYSNWFFKSSLIIQIASYIIAISMYIYHLTLLYEFDNSEVITLAQAKLSKMVNSNLKTIGVLWLALPAYSMWFMSDTWMNAHPASFWFIQTPLVIVQAAIGIWLYKNFDLKNVEKKWFKWFMSKGEFAKIAHAQDLLNQLKAIDKI
jgi:hypothetical protein